MTSTETRVYLPLKGPLVGKKNQTNFKFSRARWKIDNGKSFSVFQYRKESLSLPIIKILKENKANQRLK